MQQRMANQAAILSIMLNRAVVPDFKAVEDFFEVKEEARTLSARVITVPNRDMLRLTVRTLHSPVVLCAMVRIRRMTAVLCVR